MNPDINKIAATLSPILARKAVKKAIVFGSLARQTSNKKSDVDLMILADTTARFFDRFSEFEEIYNAIKNRSVDLLIYTPDELEAMSHRPFIKHILEEGVTIYES